MPRLTSLILLTVTSIGITAQASAQQVQFQSTPVANSCNAPNVITMTPAPAVWIAPQGSKVLTKVVTTFQTPLGNFVPVGNHVVQPGNFCFFQMCGGANIVLTCAPVGKDSDATVNITLKLVSKESSEPAKK